MLKAGRSMERASGTSTYAHPDSEIKSNRIEHYDMVMAYAMQSSVPEVADLSSEPKEVLESYGPDVSKPGSFAKPLDGPTASGTGRTIHSTVSSRLGSSWRIAKCFTEAVQRNGSTECRIGQGSQEAWATRRYARDLVGEFWD